MTDLQPCIVYPSNLPYPRSSFGPSHFLRFDVIYGCSLNGKHDSREKQGGLRHRGRRCVAVVLLAEAERAAAVALRHADVVDDEEVDLQPRGARPPDAVVRC